MKTLRQKLIDTAVTVQYDAAREPGRQLGVELPPAPFTSRQQRQSRMEGGEEEDGTNRDVVEVTGPVRQPYMEREDALAAAECRMACVGSTAFGNVSLTGAFQSSFPPYRQRCHFGDLSHAPHLADLKPCPCSRRLEDIFDTDEEGKIVGVRLPDGSISSRTTIEAEGKQWARHFAQDVFNNHCTNHEHDCTETCIKYVKKKLEAKESLRFILKKSRKDNQVS